MLKIKIKIHSTTDIITNSSSVTFSKKGDKDTVQSLVDELFSKQIKVYRKGDDCYCDCYDKDELCDNCLLDENEYVFSIEYSDFYSLNYEKFAELIGAKHVY